MAPSSEAKTSNYLMQAAKLWKGSNIWRMPRRGLAVPIFSLSLEYLKVKMFEGHSKDCVSRNAIHAPPTLSSA